MGPQAARRPWHRGLSLAAVLGGLVLLGMAGGLLARHWSAPPVYRYVMGEPVAAADLGALAAVQPALTVRHATVVSDDSALPLAELQVAESTAGPVLLDWRARVDDPFLTLTVPPADVTALAEVLQRHVPPERTVLAWWDSSRQFGLLAKVNAAFDQHLGTPLFVPARWRASRASVEAIEQAFWRGGEGGTLASEQERFQQFADALLAPEQEGMRRLQALAGGQTAVLVLHLRDIILLGQMAPERLGVAFQDFGATGDVHGMVRGVHAWLEKNGYSAYGVLQGRDMPVRAVALTDEASGRTLAARLLPFMGNEQSDVAGATLVYQVGGFSVFEIAPADVTAAAPAAEHKP